MADTKKTINDLSTTQSTLANVNIMVQPKSANNTLEKMDGSLVAAASDVTALQTGITGGTVVAKKAEQDASGNTITTTYETKADANDLKNAINQLDHRVQNIEQSKGDYIVASYKDGSTTPSGKGKWCVVEGVEGVSRVENQLFKTSASRTIGGVTCTNVDGTLTLSGVSTSTYAEIFDNMQIVANHSYLVYFADVVNPNNLSFNVGSLNTNVKSYLGTPKVATPTNGLVSSGMGIESYSSGTDFTGISFKFFIRDLNVHFGTSDLSFLGATDSAKLATIQKDYPHLLIPSDYGTRIVDWTGNGVRAEGVNIWDEEWESGLYNQTTGEKQANGNYGRSRNLIPVIPNQSYYFLVPTSYGQVLYFAEFDADGNYLGYSAGLNSAVQMPSNCVRIGIYMYGWTSNNHDIQICDNSLSDAVKTTYHPHMENTLSFPSTTLKSAGSVRDTLELNVEVDGVARRRDTQRVATYSFTGSEGWAWDASGFWYMSGYTERSKFDTVIASNGIFVRTYTNSNIVRVYSVDNPSVTSSTIMNTLFKSGTTMNYALYTEVATLSDPIIDNTLLTEAGGRLSTVQTGTVVDGISDLGFITL